MFLLGGCFFFLFFFPENNEAIENFSMQYATDSNLVKKAIERPLEIKRRENIRANQGKSNVQERNENAYDEYN